MKRIVLILILFHNAFTLKSQQIFQHNYGNIRNERCQSAFSTSNGGLILNGVSTSFGSGDADGLMIQTDMNGNILWSKTCGTAAVEIPTFSIPTYDNKIICIGTTNASGSDDALLYKMDSAGNFLWAKTYGGINGETGNRILELQNHDYAFTGSTQSYGSGQEDIYFIKTNPNGDTLLTKIYGTANNESSKSITSTSDHGFMICGKSTSIIGGAVVIQAILMRIDSSGNLLWTKLYGDSLFQEAQSVEQTSDGGFIVCGSRDFTPNGNYDILLFKTDSAGTVQWSKTYGGNNGDASYSVHVNEDGTYVLSGYTNSMGIGHSLRLANPGINYLLGNDSTNIFLMKTDASGDTIWTRTYGDSLQEEAFLSAKTTDGGFVLCGFSDYHNADSAQMLVIKTDGSGNSGCFTYTSHPIIVTNPIAEASVNYNQQSGMSTGSATLSSTTVAVLDSTYCLSTLTPEMHSINEMTIFPNPSHDEINIKFDNTNLEFKSNFEMALYNSLGVKLIIPHSFDNNEFIKLNVSDLSRGIYFVVISNGTIFVMDKFIKE